MIRKMIEYLVSTILLIRLNWNDRGDVFKSITTPIDVSIGLDVDGNNALSLY